MNSLSFGFGNLLYRGRGLAESSGSRKTPPSVAPRISVTELLLDLQELDFQKEIEWGYLSCLICRAASLAVFLGGQMDP